MGQSLRCVNNRIYFLDLDMAGRHKARLNTIHVVRTCVVPSFADIKRPEPKLYAVYIYIYILLNILEKLEISNCDENFPKSNKEI